MNLYQYQIFFLKICVLLLSFLPQHIFCFSENKAKEILNSVQSNNKRNVFNAFIQLEESNISFKESQDFLESLIAEINSQYHLSLSVLDACQLVRQKIHLFEMPAISKEELLLVIQLIEKNFVSNPEILPEDSCFSLEDQSAVFLGHGIYWPWEWNWFGLNKKHSKPKTFSRTEQTYQTLIDAQKAELQLELPPKMAAGFACILGGALICIIPGGQAVGLTLIGTGVGLTFDGMANGERPYYIDSGTSQEFP